MEDLKDNIFRFISTHESKIANDMNNRDGDINVRFTTFGNRAGCKAVYDVISMLDEETADKVIEMMKNKRVE